MTARERLIESYVKLVVADRCSIDAVPKSIRNDVALRVAEIMDAIENMEA